MIVTETLGGGLIRTYSDAGVMIHGGSPGGDYVEAIDPASAGRTYTETDIPIPDDEDHEYYEEAGRILLGKETD